MLSAYFSQALRRLCLMTILYILIFEDSISCYHARLHVKLRLSPSFSSVLSFSSASLLLLYFFFFSNASLLQWLPSDWLVRYTYVFTVHAMLTYRRLICVFHYLLVEVRGDFQDIGFALSYRHTLRVEPRLFACFFSAAPSSFALLCQADSTFSHTRLPPASALCTLPTLPRFAAFGCSLAICLRLCRD